MKARRKIVPVTWTSRSIAPHIHNFSITQYTLDFRLSYLHGNIQADGGHEETTYIGT